MSLYQDIFKYLKFPVGHSITQAGDAFKGKKACLQMKRLIKCSIMPPRRLYQPVLPYGSNNKLLFCLSRSCIYERNISGECKHLRDDERTLTRTWVLEEFRLAVENVIKSSTSTRCTNIKSPNTVVKQTKEGFSSLYKHITKTKSRGKQLSYLGSKPEEEERYYHSFRESEGIDLDKASIKNNAAKRGLANLCLNNIREKITGRNNTTHTKLISNPKELYRFLAKPVIEALNPGFANEEFVWVSRRFTAE